MALFSKEHLIQTKNMLAINKYSLSMKQPHALHFPLSFLIQFLRSVLPLKYQDILRKLPLGRETTNHY